MTLKERRAKRLAEFRAEMDHRKAEKQRLEDEGNTFMLALLDIKESKMGPYDRALAQIRLAIGDLEHRMMAKTGICPCCGQPAPVTSPSKAQSSAQ